MTAKNKSEVRVLNLFRIATVFALQLLMSQATFSQMLASNVDTKIKERNDNVQIVLDKGKKLQLYALDGGRLDFEDMGEFSETGEYTGKRGTMVATVFLIHHGKDWMLWDTGAGDAMAAAPNGVDKFGIRFTVKQTIVSQLAKLNLKPDDIRYVALSHLHADHAGNVALFPKATFLIDTNELTWAKQTPTPGGLEPSTLALLDKFNVDKLQGDRDVFGDGSVQLLMAPGHTQGHRVLLVKLENSGALLISGDLYHTRQNYEKGLIPVWNADRAALLESYKKFEILRDSNKARVIIQHAPEDFAAMPAFPKYLD